MGGPIRDMQPGQFRIRVAMYSRRQPVGLINNAERYKDLPGQIIERGCERRTARGANPAQNPLRMAVTGAECRFGRYARWIKCSKCSHGCTSPTPAVAAMAVGHGVRGLGKPQAGRAAIAPGRERPGVRSVRRQPGAPRSPRECSGATDFRCPFSGSALRTDNRHKRLAYAGKPRRGQSHER